MNIQPSHLIRALNIAIHLSLTAMMLDCITCKLWMQLIQVFWLLEILRLRYFSRYRTDPKTHSSIGTKLLALSSPGPPGSEVTVQTCCSTSLYTITFCFTSNNPFNLLHKQLNQLLNSSTVNSSTVSQSPNHSLFDTEVYNPLSHNLTY